MEFSLQSPAFAEARIIPRRYTCDGADLSPSLEWSFPPEATQSFALIVDDPDAPAGTWVHWVLYNIPASEKHLPEAVITEEVLPNGARQGINDFRRTGYGGPCPPKGAPHRYFFTLYALDCQLALPAKATKQDLQKAMEGHILAKSQLLGIYGREPSTNP